MKRILCIILTLITLLGITNLSAFAAETKYTNMTEADILDAIKYQYELADDDINYVFYRESYPISVDFHVVGNTVRDSQLRETRPASGIENYSVLYNMYVIANNYQYITYTGIKGRISNPSFGAGNDESRYLIYNRFCVDHCFTSDKDRTGIELDYIPASADCDYITISSDGTYRIDWCEMTLDAGAYDAKNNKTLVTEFPTVSNITAKCIGDTIEDFGHEFHGYTFDRWFGDIHEYFRKYSNIESRKQAYNDYITYYFHDVDIEVSHTYVPTVVEETTTTEEDIDPLMAHFNRVCAENEDLYAQVDELNAEIADLKEQLERAENQYEQADELYIMACGTIQELEYENERLSNQVVELFNTIKYLSNPVVSETDLAVGDCDGNGTINIADLVLLARYIAGDRVVLYIPTK